MTPVFVGSNPTSLIYECCETGINENKQLNFQEEKRMLKLEELEKMSCTELVRICREKGIQHYSGKTRFRKNELVEAVFNYCKEEKEEEPEEKEKNALECKEKYIEEAEKGTLIAFLEESGKPNTAALVSRSSKRKKLKLVTAYGKEFIVDYSSVLWVKKRRWPKGIYLLLKGWRNNEKEALNK